MLNIFLGFILVIFGYGILMGLWWNVQKIVINKGITSSSTRMISGLMAGLILIPLSLIFYGLPQKLFSINVFGSLLISIILNIIIAYCWTAALEKTDPTVSSQIQAFGPIISLFVGKLLLNELPNSWGITGIFITLIGLYLFSKNTQNDSFSGPIRQILSEWKEWLAFALIAGLAAGVAVPFDKINILNTNSMLAPGLTLLFGWGLFYSFSKKNWQSIKLTAKENFKLLMITGLCFGLANGLQGIAYTLVPTAVMVGMLKRIDALWAIFFALVIFKLPTRPFRLSGAFIIFLGVLVMGVSNLLK